MGPIEEIMLKVASPFIGWVVIDAFKRGVRLVKESRPLEKLYPFNRKSQVWIVLSEFEIEKPGEYFDKVSPIDGVYSFDDLSDYLRKIGLSRKNFDTRFSSDLTGSYCQDDLILIGGYENNHVSKKMNDEYYQKRRFRMQDNKIIERGGSDRVWGIGPEQEDREGRIKQDFCLITKMPNPFCKKEKKTWVVAFEGVREYGTWGAVRFWNEKIFKQLKAIGLDVKRDDMLEIVVAIDVNHDNENLDGRVIFGDIKAAYLNEVRKK